MDWQPIETAPKDATPILMWHAPNWTLIGWFYEDGSFYRTDGLSFNRKDPTHWMPLPDPPQ